MFVSILKFLFIALEVLLIFNLLIFVHELGHFLAGKWRGLYIEEFALWFGKPLWRKKIGGVWYAMNSLPFGGYVKLPQMAPMEALEGGSELPPEALKPISPLDKIIVALAGPLFSFGLACVFAIFVWTVGRPVSEAEATTTIGYVMEDSPGAKAGLRPGDKLLEVDGRPVSRWHGMGNDSIVWRIIRSEGATLPIKFERGGKIETVESVPVIPETKFYSRKGTRQLQIAPAEAPVIGKVEAGTPAEAAKLEPKDAILAINGARIFHPVGLSDYIGAHPGEPLRLTIERAGKTFESAPLTSNAAVIREVIKGGPAAAAGLLRGDRVTAFNSQPVVSAEKLSAAVRDGNGAPVSLTISRKGVAQTLTLKPVFEENEKRSMIGVGWVDDLGFVLADRGRTEIVHTGPVEQVRKAATSIFDTVGAIASKSDVKIQHMGGPLMMMRVYYNFFQMDFADGWRLAFWFSVILNVNLAMLNMLPLPVLDGGHITLAILEGIRRKPINVRVLEFVQTGCAMLIIGFMLYICFFDVQDWFGGDAKRKFHATPAPAETAK